MYVVQLIHQLKVECLKIMTFVNIISWKLLCMLWYTVHDNYKTGK